jgi:hypothetical protein
MPDAPLTPRPALQFVPTDDDAALLADVVSIQVDLGHVLNACRWLIENMTPVEEEVHEPAATLIHAVWESALITYGRCFSKGWGHFNRQRRTRLPADLLKQLAVEHRATHKAVMDERNRHVAHRDNDRQQAQPIVVLTEPPASPGVVAVPTLIIHTVAKQDMPQRLHELTTALALLMKRSIIEQRDLVAAAWGERLDEAYAVATRTTPTIDLGSPSTVAMSIFDADD